MDCTALDHFTYKDAIFFRGCGYNIPAGVTVELYEWMA